MSAQFYVYTYSDPIRSEVFYVGKGKGKRAVSHMKKSHNKMVDKRIAAIIENGSMPEIKIIRCESEDEAFKLEIQLIAKYGRRDLGEGTLWNFTDGGEGASGSGKALQIAREKAEMREIRRKRKDKREAAKTNQERDDAAQRKAEQDAQRKLVNEQKRLVRAAQKAEEEARLIAEFNANPYILVRDNGKLVRHHA